MKDVRGGRWEGEQRGDVPSILPIVLFAETP